LLKDSGIAVVRPSPRSPNLNAYAERFVRSIKNECVSRMIFFGERSLRKATGGSTSGGDDGCPHIGAGSLKAELTDTH